MPGSGLLPICSNLNNTEFPLGQHTGKRSFPGMYGQHLFGIVPTEVDGRINPLFVIIVVVLIFVKRKFAVSTFINPNFELAPVLLFSILHFWSYGQYASGFHVQGKVVQTSNARAFLSTLIIFVGPEIEPIGTSRQINPGTFFLGEIDCHTCGASSVGPGPSIPLCLLLYFFRRILGMNYRGNQKRFSKHKLIRQIPYFFIVGKIHDQSTHKTRLLVRYLPRSRVNVGQKRIPEANGPLNGIVNRFSFFSEMVNLSGQVGPMRTHHGIESPKLQPANIQLLEHWVFGSGSVVPCFIVSSCKETTNIAVPMRNSGKREVKTGRNLLAVILPGGKHIARPYIGAVALLSRKSRAC